LRRHIEATVKRYDGHFTCHAGDGLVACWGYPRSAEQDARLAVRAALEIVAARPGGYEVRCALDASILDTCILDTCFTVTGEPGTAGPHGLDLAGATPETALRILKRAPPNSVTASDVVRRLSAYAFHFGACSVAAGYGSDHPGYWRVLGPRRRWRRSIPITPARAVGRERELEAMHGRWQQVLAGTGQIVLISGEAGIGKSVLLARLRDAVVGSRGNWVEAGCLPEMKHAALAPVREAMRELAADGAGRLSRSDRHLIASLRIDQDGPGRGGTRPTGRHERLTEVLIQAIAAATARRPLALVFEDLHWADEATLAFLVTLGLQLHDLGQVLLVCTSREPISPIFAPCVDSLQLTVGRLASHDIERMLAQTSYAAPLSPETLRLIAEHSDGIPQFAAELAMWWAPKAPASSPEDMLAGPSSLNAALSARLDALGERKPLAQAAAVAGRDFDVRALAAALEMDPASLAAHLDCLAESGIIARQSHHIYRFSHCLLHEWARNSLPEVQRRLLHRKIAEALSLGYPRITGVKPEVVAAHFLDAGDLRGAFNWWRHAAERAIEIASSNVAAVNLRRALSAKAERSQSFTVLEEIELLNLLGVQLTQLRGGAAPETITTYERALDLAAKVPSVCPQLRFDLSWGLDSCHIARGDIGRALVIGEDLLAIAAAQASEERLMLARRMHAVAKLLSGAVEDAIHLYSIVLARYEQSRDGALRFGYASDQGAVAHAHLAWALAIAGRSPAAVAHARAALALAGRLDHAHTSTHVVCVLATAMQILDDPRTASALAIAGKALSNRHDFPYWSAWAGLVLGWIEGCRKPEQGMRMIEQSIDAYRSTGAEQALPYGYLLLAQASLNGRRAGRALESLEWGWRLGEQRELRLYGAETLRLHAQAEAQLGSPPARVIALLEQAIRLARKQGALAFAVRAERTAQSLFGGHRIGGAAPSGTLQTIEPVDQFLPGCPGRTEACADWSGLSRLIDPEGPDALVQALEPPALAR
jgi:hypothetical protein